MNLYFRLTMKKQNQKLFDRINYFRPKTQAQVFSEIFCLIVYSSRLAGLTPLQIQKSGNSTKFHFKLISWSAFFSGLFQIFFVMFAIVSSYSLLTGQAQISRAVGLISNDRYNYTNMLIFLFITHIFKNFSKTASFIETTMVIYELQFAFCGCVPVLSTFWSSIHLSHFLNNWITYAENFQSLFPRYCHVNGYSHIYTVAKRKLAVIVLLTSTVSIWFPFMFPYCFLHNSTCKQADLQITIISVCLTTLSLWMITFQVYKLGICTKIIIEAFKQVKFVLNAQIQSDVIERNFRQLLKRLYFIRKEFRLLRKLCSPFHVVLAGFFFTSSIMTWILTLYYLRGQGPPFVTGFSLGFLGMQGIVLLMIAVLSEKISKQENDCVKIITELKLDSRRNQVEVRTMCKISLI